MREREEELMIWRDAAREGAGTRLSRSSRQAAGRCSGPRRGPLHLSPCSVAISRNSRELSIDVGYHTS